MQNTINDIYKTVASTKNKDLSLVKSIGDVIFSSLQEELKFPKKLIIRVKGIGNFFVRRKRLLDYVERMRELYTDVNSERAKFVIEQDPVSYERKRKQYYNFCERLEEYETYLDNKQKIREIRKSLQTVNPKRDDNESHIN